MAMSRLPYELLTHATRVLAGSSSEIIVQPGIMSAPPEATERIVVAGAMQPVLSDGFTRGAALQDGAAALQGGRQRRRKAGEVATEVSHVGKVLCGSGEVILLDPLRHWGVVDGVDGQCLAFMAIGCCFCCHEEAIGTIAHDAVDVRGQAGTFRLVGGKSAPEVERELLLVILAGHARHGLQPSEALRMDADGGGGVGVEDVVAGPLLFHGSRHRSDDGLEARTSAFRDMSQARALSVLASGPSESGRPPNDFNSKH